MPFKLPDLTVPQIIVSLVDVTIVAYLFYRLFLLIRGTRAVQLIQGIVVLLVAWAVSGWFDLETTNWILGQVTAALVIALPIVFQPELRRALEQMGRGRFFARHVFQYDEFDREKVIDEIVRAVTTLSRKKVGAILVLERETGLEDIVETGIKIDGVVSSEFLVNIFIPNTPLHDGAVIVRGQRVLAAACFLPLAEAQDLGPEYGSRHRAGIGITEHSDAVSVVVSEETGVVSLANAGKLIRHLDEKTLKEMLLSLYHPQEVGNGLSFWPTRRNGKETG